MLRVAIPLLLGVVCATQFPLSLLWSLVLFIIAAALFIFLRFKVLIYPLIFIFGLFVVSLWSPSSELETTEKARVTLSVGEENQGRIIAIYSPESQEWQRCNHKVSLYGGELTPHTTVVGEARIKPYDPETSDYFKSFYFKRIRHRVTLISLEKQSAPSPPLSVRLNRWALTRLESLGLNAEAHSLSAAMTLARRELLSEEVIKSYRASGTSHIMALSGMHMGIVLLLVWWLVLPFAVAHRGHLVSSVVAIVVIWLFAVMAGLGDSILRAAWMFSLLQLSLLFSKRYGSLNSMCTTLLLMLAFDPFALYDLGFQLSFISVAVIVVVAAPLTRHIHLRPFLLDVAVKSIIVSFVATAAVTPIVSHYFGYLTLMSPISTLVLLPTLIAIICATLLWILCPIAALAPAFRWLIESATTIQNFLSSWFADQGWGYVDLQMTRSQMWVSYLCLLILMLAFTLIYQRYESKFTQRDDDIDSW